MPKLRYDTDSDESPRGTAGGRAAFGTQHRSLHALFGGGRVADVFLWRNKQLSVGILVAATMIWFLFEVAEYHFLTLLCHLSITAMLVLFVWSNAAALVDRAPPQIPEIIVSERAFKDAAVSFHSRISSFFVALHDVACGKNLKLFLVSIASLWVISVVASCCSSLTLLYLGFLGVHTLPALYERYEEEVDHLATRGSHDLQKIYKKVDNKVLNKIPRAPVKKGVKFK